MRENIEGFYKQIPNKKDLSTSRKIKFDISNSVFFRGK